MPFVTLFDGHRRPAVLVARSLMDRVHPLQHSASGVAKSPCVLWPPLRLG